MRQGNWVKMGREETAVSPSSPQQLQTWRYTARLVHREQQQIRQQKFWLGLIILERFLTRLFSEKFGLLPGWTNFLDLPVLVAFAIYVLLVTRHSRPKQPTRYGVLVLLFLFNFVASAFFNLDRLHPGAITLFLLGFLEPLAFMGLAYALMPKAEIINFLVKVLNFVGWIQIPTVLLIDLPRFFATRNPDFISGTFGENAYQLVFFLLSWNVIILAQQPAQTRMKAVRIGGILLLQTMILWIILLAQFRSIIPFALITWALTYLFVNRQMGTGIIAALFGTILFLAFFFIVNTLFPELRYGELLQLSSRTSEVEEAGKIQAIQNFGRLINEEPQVVFIGTGPATYASRGFRTFSVAGRGDAANDLYREIFQTDYYVTDVATKYVLPTASLYAFGAATTASPWFTYLALPAEMGFFGLLMVLWMYFRAILICWRNRFAPQRVGVLAGWVFVAMVLLLQMGFLENWLEVSRLTVPVWTVFGVVLAQIKNQNEPDSSASIEYFAKSTIKKRGEQS